MAVLGWIIGTIIFFAIVLVIAIPVLLIWGGVSVLRALAGGPRKPRGPVVDPAVDQLRYRLARGEITQAQFEQAMWDLGYEKVR